MRPALIACTACLLLPLLSACNRAPEAASPGGPATPAAAPASGPGASASGPAAPAAAPAGPPVSVGTVAARKRDLEVQVELTGSAVPLASIDVKPQLSAIVQQVHVREGQSVRKGDLLFTLDSRSDQANVARLQAQLAKDEAALADAKRQLARQQELVAQGFISQGAIDTSRAQVEAQLAVVAADKAAIDAARIPLGQARITAPQAGRVGQVPIFPGSVVKANETTLLTITQLDPMDVAFALPQRYLAEALAALQRGGTRVEAILPDRPGRLAGRLQFIDNAVDPASGTVRVKARFANAQQTLWPGAFVRLMLTTRTLKDAVVVPQAAIVQSPRGTLVFTVAGGKAQPRPVEVLHTQGEDAAVSGLKPGERVVLDGRQNLRPGSAVVERSRPSGGQGGPGGPGAPGAAAGAGGAGGAGGGAPPSGKPGADVGAPAGAASRPAASPAEAAAPGAAPGAASANRKAATP